MMRNDHVPILTILNSNRSHTNKLFRFENWWLYEQNYQTMVQQSWNRSASRSFADKTRFLAGDLRRWRRKKPRLDDQLVAVEHQLLQQQSKPPQHPEFDLQKYLTQQHQQLPLRTRNSISNELRKTGQLRETAILLSFIMP
jgi:hypothetical protein